MASETRKIRRFYAAGHFYKLEKELETMAAAGWEPAKISRFSRAYRPAGAEPRCFRFGCVNLQSEKDAYIAAQTSEGWTLSGERGDILLFSRPGAPEEDTALIQGREPFRVRYAPRIKRRVTFRMWMVVLGALLMIAGYVTSLLPLMYSCVLPLGAVIPVTLQIKYMEEGLSH